MDLFEKELVSHAPALHHYASRLVLPYDISHADDAVQETLCRAIAHRADFTEGTLRGWMFTILRNYTSNWRRTEDHRRHVCLDDIEGVISLNVSVWLHEQLRVEADVVLKSLARLSKSHRNILVLIKIDGYSYIEAAELFHVEIGTVKSRTSRAMVELNKKIYQLSSPTYH